MNRLRQAGLSGLPAPLADANLESFDDAPSADVERLPAQVSLQDL